MLEDLRNKFPLCGRIVYPILKNLNHWVLFVAQVHGKKLFIVDPIKDDFEFSKKVLQIWKLYLFKMQVFIYILN